MRYNDVRGYVVPGCNNNNGGNGNEAGSIIRAQNAGVGLVPAHHHGSLAPIRTSPFGHGPDPEIVAYRMPVAAQSRPHRSVLEFGSLNYSPENIIGSHCGDADVFVCDRGRMLPAQRGLPYDMVVTQPDYTTIGTVGQTRACADRMYTEGRLDTSLTVLVNAGADFIGTFTDFNLSLGFLLSWGVSLLSYSPFQMRVVTSGWETFFTHDVDRALTVFVDGRAPGGQLFIPWASRTQGMTQAIAQLGMPEEDGEGGREATITIDNVPAAIVPAFSASVQLMTAFTPYTAAYLQMQGTYTPGLKVD